MSICRQRLGFAMFFSRRLASVLRDVFLAHRLLGVFGAEFCASRLIFNAGCRASRYVFAFGASRFV